MKFCPKSDRKSSRPSIYLQKLLHFLGEFDVYQAAPKGKGFYALLCNLSSWEMAHGEGYLFA